MQPSCSGSSFLRSSSSSLVLRLSQSHWRGQARRLHIPPAGPPPRAPPSSAVCRRSWQCDSDTIIGLCCCLLPHLWPPPAPPFLTPPTLPPPYVSPARRPGACHLCAPLNRRSPPAASPRRETLPPPLIRIQRQSPPAPLATAQYCRCGSSCRRRRSHRCSAHHPANRD